MVDKELNYDKLRSMIARCQWTFAKTMPWCPHEYIVRGNCPLQPMNSTILSICSASMV